MYRGAGDNQGIGIPDPGGSWEFADGGLDAGTSDFTISAWFNWSSSMTEQYPTIVYKGGGSNEDTGYWFNFDMVTNGIDVRVSNGTARFVANSNTSLGIDAGEWHYVTVVFDREPGLDTDYFYLNGDPAGSASRALVSGDSVFKENSWVC